MKYTNEVCIPFLNYQFLQTRKCILHSFSFRQATILAGRTDYSIGTCESRCPQNRKCRFLSFSCGQATILAGATDYSIGTCGEQMSLALNYACWDKILVVNKNKSTQRWFVQPPRKQVSGVFIFNNSIPADHVGFHFLCSSRKSICFLTFRLQNLIAPNERIGVRVEKLIRFTPFLQKSSCTKGSLEAQSFGNASSVYVDCCFNGRDELLIFAPPTENQDPAN